MNRHASRFGMTAAIATLGLGAFPARGEICADHPSADSLAQAASELIRTGDVRQACAYYHKSARLEPTTRRYLRLAECQEKVGMTASAWLTFAETRDKAEERGEKELAMIARQRAARLEGVLARVIIATYNAAEIDGLEIRRDGALVPEAALGVPVPVDPGPHVITAKAPGRRAWSTEISLSPGKATVTVIVPNLDNEARAAQPRTVPRSRQPPGA